MAHKSIRSAYTLFSVVHHSTSQRQQRRRCIKRFVADTDTNFIRHISYWPDDDDVDSNVFIFSSTSVVPTSFGYTAHIHTHMDNWNNFILFSFTVTGMLACAHSHGVSKLTKRCGWFLLMCVLPIFIHSNGSIVRPASVFCVCCYILFVISEQFEYRKSFFFSFLAVRRCLVLLWNKLQEKIHHSGLLNGARRFFSSSLFSLHLCVYCFDFFVCCFCGSFKPNRNLISRVECERHITQSNSEYETKLRNKKIKWKTSVCFKSLCERMR